MKTMQIALLGGLLTLGAVTPSLAQTNLVQSLTFSLTAIDEPTLTTTKKIRIVTKDVIRLFASTNVTKGQLWLVTPDTGTPGTIGNLNSFLRITSGATTVLEVPTPDSFNLFQDYASSSIKGNTTTVSAINRFSIDYGGFHSELQGFSTWKFVYKTVQGINVGGSGSFTSSVNGRGTEDGVTQADVPMQGTITAGAPKPGV
jgi:hypothetical protein